MLQAPVFTSSISKSSSIPGSRPRARRSLLLACALALGAASVAAPASAAWHVQSIPGASCSPANQFDETYWVRDRSRLRNTGTGGLDLVLATCAISEVAPGWIPREYRVDVEDPEERDAYCQVYDSGGTWRRTQWYNWESTYFPVWSTIGSPFGGTGFFEITFHCLLHPGASLNEIEIVWQTP